MQLKLQIPDTFYQEETRCDYTISCEMKKIWAVELDLLAELDRVCSAHGIRYFADGGTLLGAARHKGFIPWDDDVDVNMPREDYDRFLKLGDEFKDPYFLQTEYTDPGQLRNHAQIRNSSTTAILASEKGLRFNQGIFLDVFPLDNLPDDPYESEKFRRKLALMDNKKSLWAGVTVRYQPEAGFKGQLKKLLHAETQLGKNPYHYYRRYYDAFQREVVRYDSQKTQKFGEIALDPMQKKWFMEKKWYKSSVKLPFEFLYVPAPVGYKEVLTRYYGDWHTFEKGTSYHGGTFFDPDHPYTEYI